MLPGGAEGVSNAENRFPSGAEPACRCSRASPRLRGRCFQCWKEVSRLRRGRFGRWKQVLRPEGRPRTLAPSRWRVRGDPEPRASLTMFMPAHVGRGLERRGAANHSVQKSGTTTHRELAHLNGILPKGSRGGSDNEVGVHVCNLRNGKRGILREAYAATT